MDGFTDSAQKVLENRPDVAQKTYETVCKNTKISISELSNVTGLSERTINNHLKLLKDANLIERVSSDRNDYWKIIGL